MKGILEKIFGAGGKTIVDSVGNALDKLITNKEELAKAKLELDKEVNRHIEVLIEQTNRQFELEVQDRVSARTREAEFVKATGHIDYLMWFLAIAGIAIFSYMVWYVLNQIVPPANEKLIYHLFGIIEGVILTIFSYYFGSSAGSRVKDMKPK